MSDNLPSKLPDVTPHVAIALIDRAKKKQISDLIIYATEHVVLVTPQYVRRQENLLRVNPAEYYRQREPHSIDIPEGFHVTYFHEQMNMIKTKHIIIALNGGKQLPPAEPLSAICELFGIASYESIMYEIHRPPRNTSDIMDFTAGNLLSKWLADINHDPNLRETHLLFFEIGDPEGYRFKSEEIQPIDHKVVVDTGFVSRLKPNQ